jgi:hypothetical protein
MEIGQEAGRFQQPLAICSSVLGASRVLICGRPNVLVQRLPLAVGSPTKARSQVRHGNRRAVINRKVGIQIGFQVPILSSSCLGAAAS